MSPTTPVSPEAIDAARSVCMGMRGYPSVSVLIKALDEARTAGQNLLGLIDGHEDYCGEPITDEPDDQATLHWARNILKHTQSEMAFDADKGAE